VAARGWRRRLGAAALAISFCGAARADESLELAPRPGVTETVVFTASAAPRANVVLLVGGNGVLAVTQKNFLLRVRGALAAGGLNVAVVDAPSDRRSGLDPHFRASAEHAKDIAAAVAFVKEKADLPVWLVGTSNGSISAANGAVRLGPAQLAGVVLTSSVWTGGMSLVPYSQIAVPVLVVHNRDDGCAWASFAGAELASARERAGEGLPAGVRRHFQEPPVRRAGAARLLRHRGPGRAADDHVDRRPRPESRRALG
jgi:pimeloyl-ACP methyl ester carboxylesterase